jgi:bacillopeptidase F
MTSVEVQWSPAGDDGSEGNAARYLVRRSNEPVSNEDDWNAAVPVRIAARAESGSIVAQVNDLPFNSTGYLTVRALDNTGNIGPLADSLAYAVTFSQKVFQNLGDSMEGMEAKEPWGLENTRDADSSFSDSPNGFYGNNLNITLALPDFNLRGNNFIFSFDHKYELETAFDFGYVEISLDSGATWKLMASFTGTADWQNTKIDLRNFVGVDSEHFKIRFRVTTDGSIAKDGWFVDNTVIHAPMAENPLIIQ